MIALVEIIKGGTTLEELFVFFLLFSISLIIYFSSKNMQPIYFLLISFSFRKESISRIIQGFFITYTLLLVSILLLLKLGIVFSVTQYNDISNTIKISQGFVQPNSLGLVLFIILVSYLYIKTQRNEEKENKNILTFVGLFFEFVIVYLLYKSGVRSAQFAVIIAYSYYFIIKIKNKEMKRKILVSTTYLLFFSSILLSLFSLNNKVLSQSGIWHSLDGFFSYRFSMGYLYYLKSGLSFFGKPFSYLDNNIYQINITVDNFYQHVLLNLGLVSFFAILLYFMFTLNYIFKKNQLTLLIPFVSFIIYGLGESSIMYFYAGFIFYFIPLFYKDYNEMI
ncbi:hypothetical protein [Lactococcus lactis]|uniref:hypothetical protein n=1 Tax=Lactococcus lactis TaxID=1358 RepID=UPI00223B64B2|nr:hypothetical protein [Lactococcus lactis]